jgi:hypothetical protein
VGAAVVPNARSSARMSRKGLQQYWVSSSCSSIGSAAAAAGEQGKDAAAAVAVTGRQQLL